MRKPHPHPSGTSGRTSVMLRTCVRVPQPQHFHTQLYRRRTLDTRPPFAKRTCVARAKPYMYTIWPSRAQVAPSSPPSFAGAIRPNRGRCRWNVLCSAALLSQSARAHRQISRGHVLRLVCVRVYAAEYVRVHEHRWGGGCWRERGVLS